MERPDIVLVGHITRDLLPRGDHRPGGSVVYGAHLASRWGFRAAVLTAAESEAEARAALPPDALLHTIISPATTTFRNFGSPRRQQVTAMAAPLTPELLPSPWRDARILFLAPVIGEIAPGFLDETPGEQITGIGLQGWLREMERDGEVRAMDSAEAAFPASATAAFVSEEDLAGTREPHVLLHGGISTYVLYTKGDRGLTLISGDGPRDLPTVPSAAVDATGAGDVFATAFLLALAMEEPPIAAAMLAQGAAARAIEGEGVSTIPTLEESRQRIARAGAA